MRNVPAALARALRDEQRRRGASLNQVAIDVLSEALGVGGGKLFDNGLAELAGGWSAREHAEFEKAVACFEEIDEDMWR